MAARQISQFFCFDKASLLPTESSGEILDKCYSVGAPVRCISLKFLFECACLCVFQSANLGAKLIMHLQAETSKN